ncbi:hypothetical protein Peur_053635 [Populus x canadensis]
MILMTTIDVNLVMFLLIIPFPALPTITVADYLFTSCSNTSNYTLNSPFDSNLKLLLEKLPAMITSLTGFNHTSVGDRPAKVYGQALCRGDVNSSSCQACVEKTSQEIFKDCRNYKDAIIWYELCQVHYSFQNMTSLYVYTGKYPDWDSQEKFLSDPKHFSDVLIYLMTNLSTEAAVNPSKHMFATGSIKFRSETVYGHAQCTRDIVADDCQTCLTTALVELKGCCSSRQGGIIVSRNCDVRFELYKYYSASSYSLTNPNPKGSNWKIGIVAFAACAPVAVIVIVIGSCIVCLLKTRGQQRGVERSHLALLQELACPRGVTMTDEGQLVSSEDLPFMDLTTIREATDNFSDSNKLGQGGFGTIYKGVLPDGKEIAVKRLSRKSWQGLEEFKNEVKVIAKLQHRNLVRLLGCGMEGDEKLLIYEFMHNKSLDIFIFDAERRALLDWETCYNIAGGIARGLL